MVRKGERRSAELIRIAFAAMVVLFVAGAAVGVQETRRGQVVNQHVIGNMFTSVELVSRLVQDEQLKQILVNAHIFATDFGEMEGYEKRIAQIDADFAAAAAEYAPLAYTPGEPETWRRFQDEVAALDEPVANVLAESRVNRDVEANRHMRALDPRYAEVDRTAAELVRLNRHNGEAALADMRNRQQSGLAILMLCSAAGVAMAIIVAAWVNRTVSARQAQVMAMTAALEERNRELDAFAGRVAHDLRSPLSSTKLAAEQLARRAGPNDRTVAILERGVARMEALIGDLLTLTRVGSAAKGSCDPAAIAHAVEDEVAPRVQEAGGAIHVTAERAAVTCSEALLHQAFANLVENAIKYRRTDVRVEVAIDGHVEDGTYAIHVRDNGIGMNGDDLGHAFEPFFRSEAARDRPGTGLGLSIVKRVVEASGGDVAIHSAVNRGTDVLIRLPLAAR
jgi:signal transduction histidine kinase